PRDPSPTHSKLQTQADDAGGGGSDRRILQQGAKADAGSGDLYRAKIRFQASAREAGASHLHAGARDLRAAQKTRDAAGRLGNRSRGVGLSCWMDRVGGDPEARENCIFGGSRTNEAPRESQSRSLYVHWDLK